MKLESSQNALSSHGRWMSLMAWFLLAGGCGSHAGNFGDDEDEPIVNANGVVIHLTDAPAANVKAVLLRASSLKLLAEDGREIVVPLAGSEPVDLLALRNGASQKFAALAELSAGSYRGMRLVLDGSRAASVVLADGSSEDLKVPSGASSGLKIDAPFVKTEGKALELVLDFDLHRSLHLLGNGRYQMTPHLRLVERSGTGTIEGEAADGEVACAYPAGGASPDTTSECATAENVSSAENGRFVLAFLPAGQYRVRVFSSDSTYRDAPAPVAVSGGKRVKAEF